MPATTRLFGLVLIVLGIASYTMTGRSSVTALIPALFGAVFVICALVGRNEAARKHAMHAAVVVGLIGAVAALWRLVPTVMRGEFTNPMASASQAIMAALLIVYVALGVQSFIAARKARARR